MNKINNEELKEIKGGGGISGWAIAGICALVSFVVGTINGIVYPSKCN